MATASGEHGETTTVSSGERRSRRALVVVLVVLAVVALVAATAIMVSNRSKPAAGEIFLVPADATGPDPFATPADLAEPSTTMPTPKPATTAPPTTTSGASSNARAVRSGSTPGLYGGTGVIGACDRAALVSFLGAHPDKARAWVAALDGDPTLTWSRGNALAVDGITSYVRELTPVVLLADTRVTNHGFANGSATTFQAVLQRGTAVLVDAYGVPRVKCACGNPLTNPAPVSGAITYRGTPWREWNPSTIIVVQVSEKRITTFVLLNTDGAGYLARPAGTAGARDRPVKSPGGSASISTTTVPGTTTPATAPPTRGTWCAEARVWFDKLAAFSLAVVAGQKPDTKPLIAPTERLIARAPTAAVKSDLIRIRNFLRDPYGSTDRSDATALERYLTGVCKIEPKHL